jgi:hypothetical protein
MKRNIHDRINLRPQIAKAIVKAASNPFSRELLVITPQYLMLVAIRSNRMVLGIAK